jgi:hypothetical protein
MGLTVHYDWKTKCDVSKARRLIVRFQSLARKLPFGEVSEVYEQDAPDGRWSFSRYDGRFRQGDLYLSRTRDDGEDDDGSEYGRRLGQGDPVEFPTRRRGYYSWHSFCKTQYAGNPKLGGEANFLRAHLSLIELLDQIKIAGVAVR